MKIVHFADAHIGMETYGSMDPASGLSTRVLDELNAMDKVIDYAIDNCVDLVLFCGDAYRNSEPSQTHQREFARRIRRLSEADIPIVIVVGNHDISGSPVRANSVEIYQTLNIQGVHVVSKPGIINIATVSGNIQVAVLPWLRRNVLLTMQEYKGMNLQQIRDTLTDRICKKLRELADTIDPLRPAILAAHIAIWDAKSGTEKSMVIGEEPNISINEVANPIYDYVALGHVHRGQVLCETPPIVYSGSLERLDFGDEGQEKGFYVVDIEKTGADKCTRYEFHSIAARRFTTIEITVSDQDLDPTGSILKEILEHTGEISGSVVRLKLSLPGHLASVLREGEIFKALKEAYNVSIAKELRRSSRGRASGWIKDAMTPLEALNKYMESNNVPVERRKKLLEYGEKLINEKFSSDRGSYAD